MNSYIADEKVNKWQWQYLVSKLILINNFIATLALNLLDVFQIIYRDVIKGNFYVYNFMENLRRITWTCLPIAMLTVSVSSIIYSIHVAPEFSSHGLSIYLGGIVALALIREGVPVMGTLAIITQFCSGITAEIGSMKVTEQLDAMKLAKVNPNGYLLLPMLFAGLFGFPIVIIVCILLALVVNFIFSNLLINITHHLYLTSILNTVQLKDIFLALIKSSVFGFAATLISYTCGILTTGGSKAIGNSTRLSIIINFVLVVILDYVITALWL